MHKVKKFRLKHGMTQVKFLELTEISATKLRGLEKDDPDGYKTNRSVADAMIDGLVKAGYTVTVQDFFDDSELSDKGRPAKTGVKLAKVTKIRASSLPRCGDPIHNRVVSCAERDAGRSECHTELELAS